MKLTGRKIGIHFLMVVSLAILSCYQGQAVFAENSASEEKTDKFLLGSFRSEDAEKKDAPMYIRSKRLDVDALKRTFRYLGEVEIIRGDIQITANKVTGNYDEGQRLKDVICEENVVITRGNGERASSNRAVYDLKSDIIKLTEGPELNKGGSVLSADLVTVFVAEDRSEAEGNVRVKVLQPNQTKDPEADTAEVYDPLEVSEFSTNRQNSNAELDQVEIDTLGR